MLAFATVREHELRQAQRTARQGYQRLKSIPHSENTLPGTLSVMRLTLCIASANSVGGNAAFDLVPQSITSSSYSGTPELAQHQQVRHEVAHERGQLECDGTRLNR